VDQCVFSSPNGYPESIDRLGLTVVMADFNIVISIVIGNGPYQATAWGCDLTHGYIDINTEYN